MDQTLIILVVFGAGFYLGWRLNDIFTRITFAKMMREAGISNKDLEKFQEYWAPKMGEEVPKPEMADIEIKIEKHGGQLYAYRADNDEFLGQGPTKEDLIQHMGTKINNVRLQVVEGKEHFNGS